MTRRIALFSVVAAVVLVGLAPARADVKLPAVFSSHMVLQRDAAVPVWGWAEAGEKVEVAFAGQTKSATAGADGKWMVKLDPMKANAEGQVLTVKAANAIELTDVLVGDVWLCSGQSNMQMRVAQATNGPNEVAAADHPKLRLFSVALKIAEKPLSDCSGQWSLCTPATVGGFSATAYFFGRDLQKAVDVPIGLIHSSWGGTPVQAWTSDESLARVPAGEQMLKAYRDQMAKYDPDAAKAEYDKALADYQAKLKEYNAAKADGKEVGRPPRQPRLYSPLNNHSPGVLFNAMIAPLVPTALKGAIWYQGESNAGQAYDYRDLLAAMIGDWRAAFGQKDLPFLFVQLPGFGPGGTWPVIRESMLRISQNVPNTGMAITIDLGEKSDIHPHDKQGVGRRLALVAEHVAYGRELVWTGPIYKSMAVKDGKVELSFDHVAEGLKVKGEKLDGFEIAGKDEKFVPAEAKIDGQKVVVWSADVAEPVAVRYDWSAWPPVTLYNSADLPASPFRTDDWLVPTQPKE